MFFTVGHSDRTLAEFLGLLADARVELVVDVRKLRGSRAHPHFDEGQLAPALAAVDIDYRALPALAGRRSSQPGVDPELNGYWTNLSFHRYADWAMGAEFADGLEQLRGWGSRTTAIMCSEAVWWRCHRRIIADHLLARGDEVLHLMGPGRSTRATLTPGALIGPNGRVSYPA